MLEEVGNGASLSSLTNVDCRTCYLAHRLQRVGSITTASQFFDREDRHEQCKKDRLFWAAMCRLFERIFDSILAHKEGYFGHSRNPNCFTLSFTSENADYFRAI